MSKTQCPICGSGELKRIDGSYETGFIDDSGRERELIVRGVVRDECANCGEIFLDDDATQKIENARLRAMGRLSPGEIKAFRESLNKTQTEMANLLGLGEKTYARWESGAYIQNAASDRYIRLLMASKANLALVQQLAAGLSGEVEFGIKETVHLRLFPSVGQSPALLETANRFTEMLTSGTTFLASEA